MPITLDKLWKNISFELTLFKETEGLDIDRKTDLLCFFDTFQEFGGCEKLLLPVQELRSECKAFSMNIKELSCFESYVWALNFSGNLIYEDVMLILTDRIEARVLIEYTDIYSIRDFLSYEETFRTVISQHTDVFQMCHTAIFQNRGVLVGRSKNPILPSLYLENI